MPEGKIDRLPDLREFFKKRFFKPFFNMKRLLNRAAWLFVVMIFFSTACKTTVMVKNNPKPLPPGQAKKLTGSQSAKQYAPGQQKKK
jgi:hypothetical protein